MQELSRSGPDATLEVAAIIIIAAILAVLGALLVVRAERIGRGAAVEPALPPIGGSRPSIALRRTDAERRRPSSSSLNDPLFVRIGGVVARGAKAFDERVIDGVVNEIGRRRRRAHRQAVQNYALGIVIGLLAMAGGYLLIAGR